MQHRPSAVELLDAVAALLEGQVVGSVDASLTHPVRVAAHLTRMVQRELSHADHDDLERRRLAVLLDEPELDLLQLRGAIVRRMENPAPVEGAESTRIHAALLATVRADLAVAKPGYDLWTSER